MHLGILVPFGKGTPDVIFLTSLLNTVRHLEQQGIIFTIFTIVGDSDIGHAREQLLWRSYHHAPEITHFLYIDDDQGWHPEHVTRLLSSDHEFCAAAVPKKTDELEFNFSSFMGQPRFHERTGFIEIRYIGVAFTMLKRSAIDALIKVNKHLHYVEEGRDSWGLFLNLLVRNDEGVPCRLSENFSFCQRWRDTGGKIWVDPEACIVHVGRKEYTGGLRDVLTPIKGLTNE